MEELIKLFVIGILLGDVLCTKPEVFTRPALDDWWGPEQLKQNYDTSIRPFKIQFDDEMITDLRGRLRNHRPFTPPLEGAAFEYGFNTNQMAGWLTYWAEKYNFTEREAYLNQFPQYKMYVQGLDMHFIRVIPKVPSDVEVVPLLMLHGWPGSTREFYKAIPLLTAPNDERGFAVELVVPSLPGFGFSSGAVRRGLGAAEIAVVLRNLMKQLGHDKFYIQGGDWGGHICNSIATQFPDEVLGYHTNYAVSFSPATFSTWIMGSMSSAMESLVVDQSLSQRLFPMLTIIKGLISETGYLHIQATKPDTVGVAMSDSPSGLLTYILQIVSMASRTDYKYRDDGGIDDLFTRDEMIDNLMFYWINNSFTTAVRIYAESFNTRNLEMGLFAMPTPVPTWTIHAKDELIYQSKEMLKFKYTNLLNCTVLDDGGHFLALEMPEIFSDNVLTALTAFRNWHKKSNLHNEL